MGSYCAMWRAITAPYEPGAFHAIDGSEPNGEEAVSKTAAACPLQVRVLSLPLSIRDAGWELPTDERSVLDVQWWAVTTLHEFIQLCTTH